jgi:cold shock CspA family protein
MKGTISKWFEYRSYGFIDVDGQEKDIFVHHNDFKGRVDPKVGDKVNFEVMDSYKGPRAIKVEIEPSS